MGIFTSGIIKSLIWWFLYLPVSMLVVEPKQQTGPQIIALFPLSERNCLERAMYFEANRSSLDGMLAVATVVMNRVNSSAYPDTICAVVGQKRQFADQVLTLPMKEKASLARVRAVADDVLRGKREEKVKDAMFFHQAGLSFPYNNMHYVHVAGGNSFYEKRSPKTGALQLPANDRPYDVRRAFLAEKQANLRRLAGIEETEEAEDLTTADFFKDLTTQKITEIGEYLLRYEKPEEPKQETASAASEETVHNAEN